LARRWTQGPHKWFGTMGHSILKDKWWWFLGSRGWQWWRMTGGVGDKVSDMFPDFKAPSTSGSGGLCSLFGVLHIPFSELLLLFRPSISGHKPPFFSTSTCLLIVIYVITTYSSGIIIAVQSFTAVYTKRMIFLSQMLPNKG
jgi:hypothetical protein